MHLHFGHKNGEGDEEGDKWHVPTIFKGDAESWHSSFLNLIWQTQWDNCEKGKYVQIITSIKKKNKQNLLPQPLWQQGRLGNVIFISASLLSTKTSGILLIRKWRKMDVGCSLDSFFHCSPCYRYYLLYW